MEEDLEAKLRAHGIVLFAIAVELAALDRRAARGLTANILAALRGAEENGRAAEAAELRTLASMIGHSAAGTMH